MLNEFDAAYAIAYAYKKCNFPHYFTDEFLSVCKDMSGDKRYTPMVIAGHGSMVNETLIIKYGRYEFELRIDYIKHSISVYRSSLKSLRQPTFKIIEGGPCGII